MMASIRTTRTWFGPVCLGLALVLVLLGCNKNKDETDGGQPGPPGPGGGPAPEEVFAKLPGGDEFAAAKKVYANNNCANCHKLGDTGGAMRPGGPGGPPGGPPGGRGGPGGPDLTSAGAKSDRTRQWLADHVRDPKTHKPQSRMPAFGPDKISDTDLDLLAAYLASRK